MVAKKLGVPTTVPEPTPDPSPVPPAEELPVDSSASPEAPPTGGVAEEEQPADVSETGPGVGDAAPPGPEKLVEEAEPASAEPGPAEEDGGGGDSAPAGPEAQKPPETIPEEGEGEGGGGEGEGEGGGEEAPEALGEDDADKPAS